MVAYLKEVNGRRPSDALASAVSGFRQREEGSSPTWVEVGRGVDLPAGSASRYGLRRETGRGCRPGHLLVGREE